MRLPLALLAAPVPVRAQKEPPPFTAKPPAMIPFSYVEQWPETRWDADLAIMQCAHLSAMRIGEFAKAAQEAGG